MNDFDRRLEAELARMLDRVVQTPAPPRRRRPRRAPVLKLIAGSAPSVPSAIPLTVLAEAPADRLIEAPGAEPALVTPALL
jgi:hypothetical protein